MNDVSQGNSPSSPLDLTARVIESRTRRFRNLVIGVVGISLIATGGALAWWSWRPLMGFVLLVPVCGCFACHDAHLVGKWQRQIMDMWTEGKLDLNDFTGSIMQVRMFPGHTLRTMLADLPVPQDARAGRRIDPRTRSALGRTMLALTRCHHDRAASATLTRTIALASLALAGVLRSWLPFWGLALILPVVGVTRHTIHARLKRLQRGLVEMRDAGDLDAQSFTTAAADLDWESTPEAGRLALLGSLTNRGSTDDGAHA